MCHKFHFYSSNCGCTICIISPEVDRHPHSAYKSDKILRLQTELRLHRQYTDHAQHDTMELSLVPSNAIGSKR